MHFIFRKERLLSASTFRVIFLIASAAALFSRFFRPNLLLGFYQDDFFYYLTIVQNLSLHGISSFDGIHLTNGYHPLWMLTLLGLYHTLPGISFFFGLQALTLVAALTFYAGIENVLRLLSISDPIRSLLTLLVSLQTLLLLRYGMEITLALPLAIWLIYFFLRTERCISPPQAFGLGLFSSLTILGRLDAVLLVGLLVATRLYVTRATGFFKWLPLYLAGMFPLFLYFAVNYYFFHLIMPVSGHAKQMKVGLLPSPIPVFSLIHPMDRMKMVFILPCLALIALGILYARRTLRTLPREPAAIVLCLLLFPAVHLMALSLLSDWVLWPWYFYPFVFSSLAGGIILARMPSAQTTFFSRWLQPLGLSLSCVYLIYIAGYAIFYPNSVNIYQSSAQLAHFMDAHPGIYAMGDQAATTGYLAKEPVIQLEGLVMDAGYLHKLEKREPLRQILADYGADYYITIAPAKQDGCLLLREPSQAGPNSPVSTGKICSPPIAKFYRTNLPIEVFPARAIQ
jgi:hypothetical protein